MVVLMLQSQTMFSRISVLGPLGRMALTNYLAQSLICAIVFYGYAMGRAIGVCRVRSSAWK